MDYKQAHNYILTKPESTLISPLDEAVQVYKVKHKMFATLSQGKMDKADEQLNTLLSDHWWMNLKCDPDEAIMLRDTFPSIIPGYHMNKRLWNTIILDGSIPASEIERMIDNSFMLVVKGMVTQDQQSILLNL